MQFLGSFKFITHMYVSLPVNQRTFKLERLACFFALERLMTCIVDDKKLHTTVGSGKAQEGLLTCVQSSLQRSHSLAIKSVQTRLPGLLAETNDGCMAVRPAGGSLIVVLHNDSLLAGETPGQYQHNLAGLRDPRT